ncbi:uncharacterized protein TNCT_264491 [Trichonephila clavata]|uniref:Uncharacterized protein n=1 Tax=Trichonephila clavata TaxID=2740835 RepID=A0A8X6KSK8_TRICU|nr:uncharacterized protein TNCT_264491 [Trichonephila clavata]
MFFNEPNYAIETIFGDLLPTHMASGKVVIFKAILNMLRVIDEDDSRNNYIDSYKQSLGKFEDKPFPKSKLGAKFYPRIQDGFFPVDMTSLNHVYWWKKRFQGLKGSSAEDLPYYDTVDSKVMDLFNSGTVKKRDYTAAQLVNMLKALAKARRQRQIRINGKGLRFGISK